MAEARLADMIVPEKFNKYVETQRTEKNVLLQSGLMVDMSDQINDQLEGKTVNMPYFEDLDPNEEDVVLDDTKDLTVSGVETGQDVAVKLFRGKAFGASDLSGDMSGADPMAHIASRYANWWNIRDQITLLSILRGSMGAANMAGNVHDISGLPDGAAFFDSHSFVDSVYKLGDASSSLTAMAAHSRTVKAMVLADLITFVPDSKGALTIPTYMGKRVLEDDQMPVSGTGEDAVFTTYLFGPGAIGTGSKTPKVPVEIERQALKGMGQEYLVHRRQWTMHPRGIKWKGSSAGPTPTNAELANPANWERVYDPKHIRIVAFKHKVAA